MGEGVTTICVTSFKKIPYLFSDSGLVELLLQHLVFKLQILFERHKLILKVDSLQSLVLQVTFRVFQLVLQFSVICKKI